MMIIKTSCCNKIFNKKNCTTGIRDALTRPNATFVIMMEHVLDTRLHAERIGFRSEQFNIASFQKITPS